MLQKFKVTPAEMLDIKYIKNKKTKTCYSQTHHHCVQYPQLLCNQANL